MSQLFFACTFLYSSPSRYQSTSSCNQLMAVAHTKQSPNRPIRSQLRLDSVGYPTSAISTMTGLLIFLPIRPVGGRFLFRPSRLATSAWRAQSNGTEHDQRHLRRCGTDRSVSPTQRPKCRRTLILKRTLKGLISEGPQLSNA
jgi:hypothetical protein